MVHPPPPGVESVTRIYNYYKKFGYKTVVMVHPPPPGVESVTRIYNYYKKFGYKTVVMVHPPPPRCGISDSYLQLLQEVWL